MSNYLDSINSISNTLGLADLEDSIVINADKSFDIGEEYPKLLGMTYDHCSNMVTFELPESIEGYALVKDNFNAILKWQIGSKKGAVKLNIDEQDAKLQATWIVEKQILSQKGKLSFNIEIAVVDTEFRQLFVWNTLPCEYFSIEQSIFVEEVDGIDIETAGDAIAKLVPTTEAVTISPREGEVITVKHNERTIECTLGEDGEFDYSLGVAYDHCSRKLKVVLADYPEIENKKVIVKWENSKGTTGIQILEEDAENDCYYWLPDKRVLTQAGSLKIQIVVVTLNDENAIEYLHGSQMLNKFKVEAGIYNKDLDSRYDGSNGINPNYSDLFKMATGNNKEPLQITTLDLEDATYLSLNPHMTNDSNAPYITRSQEWSSLLEIGTLKANKVTTIGPFGLHNIACGNCNFDELVKIEKGGFSYSSIADPIVFPKVTQLGQYAFTGISGRTIALPNLKSLEGVLGAFGYAHLTSISLPALTGQVSLGNFSNCKAQIIDLGLTTYLTDTIVSASNLEILILRGKCNLAASSAFKNTPFVTKPTACKIYVSKDYVSFYQTATNWSQLFANGVDLRQLEGSAYA